MMEHLEPGFGPLDLEVLPRGEQASLRAHLAVCDRCAAELRAESEALARVALSMPPVPPSPQTRQRLLASVAHVSRFDAFSAQVAKLIDVTADTARGLLARIDDAAAWVATPLEGIWSYDLDGGPAVAEAVVGFVKVKPGVTFPEHSHVGEDAAFVVQGSCAEADGRISKRGDLIVMAPGTAHELRALPGPDFIYLGVAQQGFIVFGQHVKKGDPRG